MASQILTYRELALREAITELGVHERGFNNRGPQVDGYQREGAAYVGWVGFPWCAAFVWRNFSRAGYAISQIKNRASVGYAEAWARNKGYLESKPARGDVFSIKFDADGWPDHTGHVERVLKLGPVLYLQTIEGNTSAGDGGSQDDGGGVYRRRRVWLSNKVTFTRVPGRPKRNPDWFLSALTGREAWIEWNLGIARYAGWGQRAKSVRPNVPAKIARPWWVALASRRKKEASK
jgi:hypothetical protein